MANFVDKYDKGDLLGSGAFAETFSCVLKGDGSKYAVKIIKNAEPNVKTEVEILRSLNHTNIVRLYEVFQEGTTISMVQELVHGGEMFDYIIDMGTYSEADANRAFGQMLEGLNYLHSEGILHRDLKPENILLSEKSENAVIKIADFGLAKAIGQEGLTKTTCGTPGYVAPEVLCQKTYGTGVDVWAAGVILYIMVSGYEPFYDANETQMFKNIMSGKFSFPSDLFANVSSEIKDVITKILVTNPEKRPTAKECLAHPWMKDHSDSQKTRNLKTAQANISKLQAKKRFKGALIAVRVGEAMKNGISSLINSPALGRKGANAKNKMGLDAVAASMKTEAKTSPLGSKTTTPETSPPQEKKPAPPPQAEIVKDAPDEIVKDAAPSSEAEAVQPPEPVPPPAAAPVSEEQEQLPGQVSD